jgi:hypothetical protein
MLLLAPISAFLSVFVLIYQWIGLPLVLIIWLTSGFPEAAISAVLFICTHFMLGATASKLFRLGRVKTGFPAVFGFLIWGGIVAFIAFIASLGYPVWMKLSYPALALSASTSPMRQILHVFNDLDFSCDPRVQAWTAYTSISGAAGMTITWSLLVFLTE